MSKEAKMKHTISTAILQEVLNYLANRPYMEVAALIKAIQDDAIALEIKSEEKTSE